MPTAPVTLLFTDIEGSTRAWEAHPGAMDAALREHNRILYEAITEGGGRVFKTVGDAFCCAFHDPGQALAAAIDAMRRLKAHAWPNEIGEIRVRMALHAGIAAHHDGDYFGPSVNRVARLMAIAHGGQILVSSSMAEALENVPVRGVTLRDLGSHRLKDLRRAEATYQVVADGLASEFPPLASLDAHPNNLPSQLSSFVGRDEELARLRRLLDECRVVTVVGSGGIGKTRLALQTAAEASHTFPGGVFLVSLASLRVGNLIVSALASALELTELPSEPLESTVIRYIGNKRMLLILDNCEHLLTDAALLVKQIVSECPSVRCIITSREQLHLTGEHVERLAPLSTPDGARLFLERARSVAGDAELSAHDSALVAEICHRVDGIPLAIELAASRLAAMPLARLAERLSLMQLASKDATIEDRHRTLRATIGWSYDLLAAAEKHAFLAASVFRGGAAPEALEYVAGADIDDEVASLIDKSLALFDSGEDGGVRYRLLEPIREFAAIKLETDAAAQAFTRRHAEYYGTLASDGANASGAARGGALSKIDAELDNLRAALERSMDDDSVRAATIVLDLTAFWRARGSFTEGRNWLSRLFAVDADIETPQRAWALRQAAAFAAMQDDYAQAIPLAENALEAYRALHDEAGIGLALHITAEVAHRRGSFEDAERLYEESLRHLEAGGHFLGRTICLMNEGSLARERGDFGGSQAILSKALLSAEELNDRRAWAQVQIERGWTTLFAGDAERADEIFQQALEAKTAERDAWGVCQARLGLGAAALFSSRLEQAREEYEAGLKEATALGAPIFIIDGIYGIAAVHAVSGDLVAAAKCCGLASHLIEKTNCGARTGRTLSLALQRIRAGLSEGELVAAMEAGAGLQPDSVIGLRPSIGTTITI